MTDNNSLLTNIHQAGQHTKAVAKRVACADLCVQSDIKLREAMIRLGETGKKLLIVVDKQQKLLGTLSDGDIRRYILKAEDLNCTIAGIYHQDAQCLYQTNDVLEEAAVILQKHKIDILPVINDERVVLNYLSWDDLISSDPVPLVFQKNKVDLPVIIMAGGLGKRLDPFTRILPKALMPLGESSILEVIIDRFRQQGVSKFYLSLNYKSEIIEAYMNGVARDYNVEYIREDEPLGTAGALKNLKGQIESDIVISNCDVIVTVDYQNALDFHRKNQSALTILSSIQHHKIPYGVLQYSKGGRVHRMKEKPDYIFNINTGVYILNKLALDLIPDCAFDMSDLIQALMKANRSVYMYPVNVNQYVDIGSWNAYNNTLQKSDIIK